jgi:hypothetical protein
VWELSRVPLHYQEEAHAMLQAEYEAKMQIAKDAKVTPEKIILPDF